jgi:hypothetical protein
MERLVDPVIADLQHEIDSTTGTRRWIVLLIGYFTFWRILAVSIPALWVERSLRRLVAPSCRPFVTAAVAAAATTLVVTAALMTPPIQAISRRHELGLWLLTLVPQALPFSIPLAIFAGIVSGLKGQRVTRTIRRAVMFVGLSGVLASCGTVVWMVPAANQAFRVAIAGQPLPRGPAEMSPQSLRNQALTMNNQGRPEKAGALLLSYHARWAIVASPVIFALFALGLIAVHLSRISTVASGFGACVVYVYYFFELGMLVRPSMFANEWFAFCLAWLPNLLIVIVSAALLSAAPERQIRNCA